jgi:hypothetical protein
MTTRDVRFIQFITTSLYNPFLLRLHGSNEISLPYNTFVNNHNLDRPMDTLPQELICRIAGYVERYQDRSHQWQPRRLNLPPLAGLSRPWKAAIEQITFRNVSITSNELDTFQEFVTGRRRHHLGTLAFQVVLPEYTEVVRLQAKPPPTEKQENETFTREVRALFAILNAWVRDGVQIPLRIKLGNILSRNDIRYISGTWDKDSTFSHLRFDDPDSLPILSNVQALVIDGPKKKRASTTYGSRSRPVTAESERN